MHADGSGGFQTEEGIIGYVEAVEFLRQQKKIPPLVWCDQLAQAADDHVQDIGPIGVTGPIGTGKLIVALNSFRRITTSTENREVC